METRELTILERIARNLPVMNPHFGRTEGDLGTIYFAWGTDASGVPHGVWGHRGMARTIEFKRGTSASKIRRALVFDAAGLMEDFDKGGLLDGTSFNA